MKKSLFAFTIVSLLSTQAFATITDDALKYVPGGKIVAQKIDEVKVQTPNGTVVEVEFTSGKLDEASGNAVDQDIFVPEDGMMSLKDAVAALKKEGKVAVGEWSIDNNLIKGWHYEFEGFEQGKKMDYEVDAKTGKLLSAEIDD